MYSTYNEGKPSVPERFIRPLKKNTYDSYLKKCLF